MARNLGEVLGVFATLNLRGPDADLFQTSADLPNLVRLEEQIKTLKPPAWPEDLLGPIDQDLAAKGRGHYEAIGCVDCHPADRPYPSTVPNRFGRSLIETRMVPLAEIGTDPTAALNFLRRTAEPGIFDAELGPDPAPAAQLLGLSVRQVIASQFDDLQLDQAEQLRYLDRRVDMAPTPEHLGSYKARPLAGIWATAPYLHNGSVPNLLELLLPAAKRSPSFRIGSRVFDAERVGFDVDEGDFEFRADLPGNSNAGHEYGAGLTDEERRELLEYLKTL